MVLLLYTYPEWFFVYSDMGKMGILWANLVWGVVETGLRPVST
jgi:hypothetical protein